MSGVYFFLSSATTVVIILRCISSVHILPLRCQSERDGPEILYLATELCTRPDRRITIADSNLNPHPCRMHSSAVKRDNVSRSNFTDTMRGVIALFAATYYFMDMCRFNVTASGTVREKRACCAKYFFNLWNTNTRLSFQNLYLLVLYFQVHDLLF